MDRLHRSPRARGWIDGRWLLPAALLLGLLLAIGLPPGGPSSDGVASAAPEEDGAPNGDGKDGDDAAAPKEPFWKPSGSEGLHVHGLSCLRIHPKDRDRLWAHVHGLGPAVSEDGGRTWSVRLAGVNERDRPTLRSEVRISLDPGDFKTLYLTIDGQIYKSEDDGERWSSITSGALASLSWDQFKSTHLSWEVVVDPGKSVHLLVGTRNDGDHNGGLYESTNGGKSWAEIAGSAQPDTGLGADTWLVRLSPSSDKYVTVAGRRGLWYSDSRGREFARNDPGGLGIQDIRWLSDFAGKELYLADARGIWRSKDGGKRWDKKPIHEGDAVGVFTDPHNRKRIFAIMAERGLEMSDDARKSKWEALGGTYGEAPEDAVDVGGYRRALPREVLVHPRDRKRIYLTSPVTGLHVSDDHGETFQPVTAPEDAKPGTVLPAYTPPMETLAAHPGADGSVLAVSSSGLVFRRSSTGTWERLGPLGMHATAVVPGQEAGHWWALGYRLRHSADDGATWTTRWPTEKAAKKLDPLERVVGIHRGPAGEGKDGKPTPGVLTILLERSGDLMRSEDDGATWETLRGPKLPSSGTWAAALAVNPANADHMVIAARSTAEAWSPRDENGGLFQTWDGGKSWHDFTGVLKPGKRADAAARKASMWWNRARFVAIDPVAGLIVYGADRRGIFTHPIVDPAAKKADRTPQWFDVTPHDATGRGIAAMLKAMTPDKTSTRYVAQLLDPGGQGSVVSITGATLAALHEGLANAAENEASDGEVRANMAWTALASPGAGVRFTGIVVDPADPTRLIASETEGPGGIHLYVDPTAVKPAQDAPKKDEEGKDEPKKPDEGAAAKPRLAPPEGMRAFTVGQDKTWRVLAMDTGAPQGQFLGHENVVHCVGLAPDETQLVTGSKDRTVRMWSAQNGKELGSVTLDGEPLGLAFDDDSAFVYVAGGPSKAVYQIKLADRSVKALEGHGGAVLCVACSEDTARAYSGGEDNVVLGWDAASGQQVLSIAVGAPVVALAVAADGSRFYAAGRDQSIAAFDAAGKPAGRLDGLAAVPGALALADGGRTLYATTKDGVLAIDTATMTVRTTHAAPEAGDLTCLAVSSDGVWILAGDASGGLWTWQRGEAAAWRPRVAVHDGALLGVDLTPEETTAPAAPADGAAPEDEGPKDEAPKGEAPKGEAPKDAPKGEAPKDAPKGEAPKDAPKDEPGEPAK